MNKPVKYLNLIIAVFLTGSAVMLNAQADDRRNEVKAMFSHDTRNLWINHLTGSIDNKHKVDFFIGTDGKECKGLYTLSSSNNTFYFEGEDTDDHIRLIEFSKSGKLCGYILGNYNGQKLDAIWTDSKKIQQLTLKADIKTEPGATSDSGCSSEDLYILYEATIDGVKVKLILNRQNGIQKISVCQDNRFFTDVINPDLIGVDFYALDFPGTVLYKKKIKTGSFSMWDIFSDNLNLFDESQVYSLKRKAAFTYECYEYADFTTRLDLVRPKIAKPGFNKWIENIFQSWLSENQKKLTSKNPDDYSGSEKWAYNVHGWVEVDYYSGDLISGTVYKQSAYEKNIQKRSFIFDINAGKELKFNDIFESDFNPFDYFDKVVNAKKKELKTNSGLRKWLDTQRFEYVTLKQNGFCFRTDFSMLYGEQEIIVSYSDLSGKLKNRTLIKELNP
ncbi:MAG: hypothetical protein IPM42_11640 [Saprospiraceae bacterium]|nr:hypothetical protein [Saprospiraceae bacterium]